MARQDGRRPRRLTEPGSIEARRSAGRAGTRGKVAKPRVPRLNGTLPTAYGETRIVVLPVDPYLVHVYWEVSASAMEFVKALVEEGALRPQAALRFHDVTALPLGGVRPAGSFDVGVDIEAMNWYVRLLSPERAYVVDLGFREPDGRFHRVARSNRMETPRAWPCAEAGLQRMRVVEVDGVVHVDPVEASEVVHDSEGLSQVSGHGPRIEMPQEGRRAVIGGAGAPVVTVEQDRIRKTGLVHGSTESTGKQDHHETRTESAAEMPQPIRPAGVQDRRPTSLPNPSPTDTSEDLRVKIRAVYERRQGFPPVGEGGSVEKPSGGREGTAETDLSLLCEQLFVSGLSSSLVTAPGKKEEQDDG